MTDTILTTQHDNWVEISLNRPDVLNAFNPEMHAGLRAALDAASDARAILLTGAGRGFCAGQDLGDRDSVDDSDAPDLSETIRTYYTPLIQKIRSFKAPVVCAVNGVAAGAGANIALSCDIVVAARSAKFIQSFARVGLVPDAGGTWMLPRLIGEARAKAISMTATPVPAEQAEAWGMIWRAIDDEALMTEARALTASLAQGATVGLGLMKEAFHASNTNDMDAQLELEAELQRACGHSSDYMEGVTAFLEKRPIQFTGK